MNAPAVVKNQGSPYSTAECRVPELIPVLCHQPAGDVNHKPSGRLPLLSAKPAVTPTTLKSAATSFTAWWTEAQWVWTVCLRLLPDSVTTAIWTQALTAPESSMLTTQLPSHPAVNSWLVYWNCYLLTNTCCPIPMTGLHAKQPLLLTHHSHHPPLPHSFHSRLKTFLFCKSFPP